MSKRCCTFSLAGVFLLLASHLVADEFEWKSAVNGDFLDPTKWALLSGSTAPPPRDGDSATFNEAGSYTVTLPSGGTLRNYFMDVFAGDVTFRRSSSSVGAAYVLERPGGILTLHDSATLQVGVPNYPLDFTAEDYVLLLDYSQLHVSEGSTLEADRLLLKSGTMLTVDSAATLILTNQLFVGNSTSSTDPAAIFEITGLGSSLDTDYLSVGRQEGQGGRMRVYDSATVSANRLDLTSDGRVDINNGALSIGGLGDTRGTIYFGFGGYLSIDSNVSIGPNGLHGGVDVLSSANTLRIGGVGTLETNEELKMLGGNYEGGTLVVSSGASVHSHNAVTSTVAAAVQGDVGSLIDVTAGELQIGAAAHVKGFYSNGTTSVSNGLLRIRDANEAVFDSGALVLLGDGSSSGTIVAQNGIALDLGADLVGYGTVDTPNSPAKRLLNNGHILGNSSSQMVTLTGYVQGLGTCDYCKITGTDAPGMSTASVNRGTVDYEGTLEIEIGSTVPGSGYDQVNHMLGAGLAELGGELRVELLGGFEPTLGDRFEFLTAQTINGQFESEALPPLAAPLSWAVEYESHSVSLMVILAGDFDRDGDVDGTDFLLWQRGESPDRFSAADLAHWRGNYGTISLLPATNAVPEPGLFAQAALLGLLTTAIGRRYPTQGAREFVGSN